MDGVILTVNFYGIFPEDWDDIKLGSEQTGYEPPKDTVEFEVGALYPVPELAAMLMDRINELFDYPPVNNA